MNEPIVKRKRYKTPDRVNLSTENVLIVDRWKEACKTNGVKVTRSDIVNWMLQKQKSAPTEQDLRNLEQQYFDPLKALEAAVVKAKRMHSKGEVLNIESLINEKILRKKPRKSVRKVKAPSAAEPL